MHAKEKMAAFGLAPGGMLLPVGTDTTAWPVIACDQHTSNRAYWQKVEALVEEKPSTLRLVLPEIYLEAADGARRIADIHQKMAEYTDSGLLKPVGEGVIFTRRTTQSGTRLSVVLCIDLEAYDFRAGAKTRVRCTEGTIETRIPPRLAIRKEALLELSHVQVLVDDPARCCIEPLAEKTDQMYPLYDMELMLGGGRLQGWFCDAEQVLDDFCDGLQAMAASYGRRIGAAETDAASPMLFAVGDGNHSLATAKVHWENLKKEGADMDHPARYAMVELINLHDEALTFEPIHRVVFGLTMDEMKQTLADVAEKQGLYVCYQEAPGEEGHSVRLVCSAEETWLYCQKPLARLPVGTLQTLLDATKDLRIDYIHGDEAAIGLTEMDGEKAVAFLLPPIDKDSFFSTIVAEGALPRKTFSMGHANEKRYYMEARRIRR